jgi:hypothetical protein
MMSYVQQLFDTVSIIKFGIRGETALCELHCVLYVPFRFLVVGTPPRTWASQALWPVYPDHC